MLKGIKHTKLIITSLLMLFIFSINAQEVRIINNKGTIASVNNNNVFTSATDPNTPTIIAVENDVWFDTSITPNAINIWDGTTWKGVSSQNNSWLKANTTDISTNIDDDIYTNGRIGINQDNPDYAIKVRTIDETIDRFLRFETNDSDDFLEISNTTTQAATLAAGFVGGTRASNRSALSFFGDTEIVDDLSTSVPIMTFFARIGSNNDPSGNFGGGPTTVNNRPLFSFSNNFDSKLIILPNGNVGIDVDTPSEKLDIDGKLRIRDIATVTTDNDLLTVTATGVVEKKDFSKYENTWLGKDDNLTADRDDTEIYKNGNVGIGNFSASTIDAQLHVKSNDIPFKIEPNTTTPTGTSGGQMHVDSTNGILYIYDGTRNKWLSVDRTMVGWGRSSANTTNEYLRQFNGAPSDNNGWRMIRNGTITAITAQTNINQTWTLEIRKNDEVTVITSLIMNNTQGNHNNNLNININEGDFIQAYCNGTSIDFPEVLIEIAWRK